MSEPDEVAAIDAAAHLADRLDAFADTLSARELAILHAMVRATMPALDRAARWPVDTVLSADEQVIVDAIEDRRG